MSETKSQAGPGDQPKKSVADLINRGVKKPNLPGTLTFVGLRSLDPLLQYQLLAGGWGTALLSKLGVAALPLASASPSAFATGIALVDKAVSATGLPLPSLVLLGMSVGSAAKQIYWLTRLSFEEFPPSAAVPVSFYNSLVNSVNSLLLLAASTSVLSSPSYEVLGLPYQVVLAGALYAAGMAVETLSEVQRKAFKDRPENKGRVMKEGLWGWARHVNYGGYAIWRGAYCMASSGWVGGLAMGLFQSCDFVFRAVPVIDEYCAGRYREQWTQFKKDVPWVILPGIY